MNLKKIFSLTLATLFSLPSLHASSHLKKAAITTLIAASVLSGESEKKQKVIIKTNGDKITSSSHLGCKNDALTPLKKSSMQVIVKNLEGRSFVADIDESTTLIDFKKQLEDVTGIKKGTQLIVHSGKLLMGNKKKLMDFKLHNLDQLSIFCRLSGGNLCALLFCISCCCEECNDENQRQTSPDFFQSQQEQQRIDIQHRTIENERQRRQLELIVNPTYKNIPGNVYNIP